MQVAIVTTQRRSQATLDSFLRWHLDGARFDHVFVYFDAPADDQPSIELARSPHFFGRVTALEADAAFRERHMYTSLPSHRELAPTVLSLVQSRQRLNAEHCLRLCAAQVIMQPCNPATLQPCNPATLQPCNHATMQPCNHATLHYCRDAST